VAPLAIDLSPALRDAYLRKVSAGPGGEPVEVAFHVLRRVLAPGEREADRLYGLRFRNVRGAAAEAVRWDREQARWVSVPSDWPNALRRRQMEPPIVGTAAAGAPETFERLARAAEKAIWIAGSPSALAGGPVPIGRAEILFELTGEAILENGWNANVRLFVAADTFEVIGPRGPIAPEELVRLGEEWAARWLDYWRKKESRPELEDPQFEWTVPTADDLAGA
jgi:hypothetical protein